MLGGSHFQIPAIKYARNTGYYVITADYLPNNPGHKYAHEYFNVSTTDQEAVLKLAKTLKVDGILSYASDPGAPTAAYVAEKLSLPGNPYESVKILQRKDLFRDFLKSNNFLLPESAAFKYYKDAYDYAKEKLTNNSIIVKPADSSGSKGVRKLDSLVNFHEDFDYALKYSLQKIVVVEEFIKKSIYEMDGDGFVWNGNLVFRCFGNQHNDIECNPYVPVGISFPYVQEESIQQKAHNIIDSILTKLDMKLGGLNIEYLTDSNNNIYVLEIGPRSGGNLIPEVIKFATGVDLIAYAVDSAVGKDCSDLQMVNTNGFYSSYILHAQQDGKIESIQISEEIEKFIIQRNIFVKVGDKVEKFNGSNNTLGTFILKFDSVDEMTFYLDNRNSHIRVITKA